MNTRPSVSLGAGIEVSRLAKGNWQLAEKHGAPVDPETAVEDMRAFVDAGVTLFDCADHYVGVEALIGEFRRRYPDRARRLRISTKVVPDQDSLARLTRGDLSRIVDTSLARLGLERLDVAQFHWWDYRVAGWLEAMHWLKDLQQAGKIALLGTTNFDTPRLREMLEGGIPLATHQLQYSVLDRRPENGLAALCARYGVRLLCYGVLAGGFLSERWLGAPDPQPPYPNRSLVKYRLIIEDFGGWQAFQSLLSTLASIGRKHGVSLSAVAMRHLLDKPGEPVALIGARTAAQLRSSLEAFSFSLDGQDRAAIERHLALARGPAGDCYTLERDEQGPHASIMWKNQNHQGAPVDTAGAYVPPLMRSASRGEI